MPVGGPAGGVFGFSRNSASLLPFYPLSHFGVSEKTEGIGLADLNIPTLDIEDLDLDAIDAAKAETVEDESGGALTYAIIGSGQGGGRIAKAFYDLGYKKCVAFNTAKYATSSVAFKIKSRDSL